STRINDRSGEPLGLDLAHAVLGVLPPLEGLLYCSTTGAVANVVASLSGRCEALRDRSHPSVLREIDEGQRRLRGVSAARRSSHRTRGRDNKASTYRCTATSGTRAARPMCTT